MPSSQTIEGGMQLRITEGGLSKLVEDLRLMVNDSLQDLSVSEQQIVNSSIGTLTLCSGGCPLSVNLDGLALQVADADTLLMDTALAIDTDLTLYGYPIVGSDFSCSFRMTTDPSAPLHVVAEIGFFIRDEDGELRVEVQGIRSLDLSGIDFHVHDCGFLTDVLDWFGDVLEQLLDWLGDVVSNPLGNWLTNNLILPWLQPYIDQMLPDPMGIEGQVDIGALLSAFSPGTKGKLEMRMTPGGYVNLLQGGISLGVITGLNSDRDPTTRGDVADEYGVKEYSEGALCVPPFPTLDLQPFVQAGDMTVVPTRNTFALNVAGELSGTMDESALTYQSGPKAGQVADLAIGISQYFLNLAGFHIINSGGLCVTMGTEQVSMLTVGMFALVVPSLGNLIDPMENDAPMKMVLRPQWPIEFSFGQGTEDSPLITATFRDLQIDFYPFAEQRYVRAMTMGLDLNIGVNLVTDVNDEGLVVVKPTILGLDEQNVTVRVHNSELIEETPEELEALLPSIMSMITPMLSSALGDGFAIPTLGNGMTMGGLEFRANAHQDILLVLGSVEHVSNPLPLPIVDTWARVDRVSVGSPEAIRADLISGDSEALPRVELTLGAQSPVSGEFEWQYRVDDGFWHPYGTKRHVTVTDGLLLKPGWHDIDVRARYKGVTKTVDRSPARVRVLVDPLGPKVSLSRDGDQVVIHALDAVTPREDLVYEACSRPGHWTRLTGNELSLSRARALADACGGKFGVRVTDEAGNRTEAWQDGVLLSMDSDAIDGVVGGGRGFGCSTVPSSSGLLWVLGLLFLLVFRRLRSASPAPRESLVPFLATGLGLAALVGLGGCPDKAPGANNNNEGPACRLPEDCADMVCQDGQIPFCVDGRCQCTDDLPLGMVGTHSSMAVVSGPTAYVASYNRTYGDLVVARFSPPGVIPHHLYQEGGDGWEFVDGVPAGPVEMPNSKVRGGVANKGDNVGTYTAVAADMNRQPVVAYHDETHGSLKFAWYDGQSWHIHVVDDGMSDDPEEGDAGWYNAISPRPSDNAPGIAYMAPVIATGDASEPYVCQLRFAQAGKDDPDSPQDWTIYVIDQVTVPELPADAPIPDWPRCTGLFPSVVRLPDGRPVVAYYDSLHGNLMMSEMIDDGQSPAYFADPVIVDGEDDQGRDTGDVGLFVSLAVTPGSPDPVYHFAYVDRNLSELYYLNSTMTERQVVDDGYRMEENEVTGLPMPVFHFMGWDAQILVRDSTAYIFYQDSTDHALRLATGQVGDGDWTFEVLAGEEDPFTGAYGFYIGLAPQGGTLYVSSYVINEHAKPDILGNDAVRYFVEIFEKQIAPE